jgi:putative transposase
VPSAIDLQRELNALKKTELFWMYMVSKKKAGKNVKVGFPRFKSKKNWMHSFRLTGHIHVFAKAIQLPRLGRLRLKESGYLP